jgi:hypothetical protein
VVEDIDFGVDFVAGSLNKLQKNWVLEGKISRALSQCVHIVKFKKLQS